jgi:hypothetical protein
MSRPTYCVRLRPVQPFREMRFVLAASSMCGMAAGLLALGASA